MVDPVASQTPARLIRGALLALSTITATLLIASVLFWLAGWLGSSIPRNPDWREPDTGVTILVETNGAHTGVVLPVVTPQKDWRETFPALAADPAPITHVAIGWGEREVFLDVATWADLELSTAVRIVLIGGESLIRTSHYVRPAPGPWHRPLRLAPAQYERLVAEIEASLAPPGPDGKRKILRGSYQPDAYYIANGRYTLFRTSNSWTGDVLGKAGVRMGWWTPFAGGVMKWIAAPSAEAD